MPLRAPKPCANPGCGKLTQARLCEDCLKAERKQYSQQRRADPDLAERDRFYKTATWLNLRAMRLRLEPLCRMCRVQNRYTAANTVDHIVAIEQGGARLDLENTQSLCGPCHSRKSALEGSRFGRAF